MGWGGQAYVFEVVPASHLLLQLFLELLAGPDALLVPGEVGQLFEPGVGEVLREVLTASLVGGEKLLRDVKAEC